MTYREISKNGSDFEKKPSLLASPFAEKVAMKLSLVEERLSPRNSMIPLCIQK